MGRGSWMLLEGGGNELGKITKSETSSTILMEKWTLEKSAG